MNVYHRDLNSRVSVRADLLVFLLLAGTLAINGCAPGGSLTVVPKVVPKIIVTLIMTDPVASMPQFRVPIDMLDPERGVLPPL